MAQVAAVYRRERRAREARELARLQRERDQLEMILELTYEAMGTKEKEQERKRA